MMHLTLPSGLHPDWHHRAAVAVRFGFEQGAGSPARRAELHVKATRPRRRWRVVSDRLPRARGFARRRDAVEFADRVGGAVEAHDVIVQRWTSGRAYDGVPGIARVEPGVRYLVTLKLPLQSDGTPHGRFPRTWRYDEYVTAPPATFADWSEELVHAAAHEGRHIWQFATDSPRSEIDAETHACAVLEAWRCRIPGAQLSLFDQ